LQNPNDLTEVVGALPHGITWNHADMALLPEGWAKSLKAHGKNSSKPCHREENARNLVETATLAGAMVGSGKLAFLRRVADEKTIPD
jgi:hypothetical protein